MANLMYSSLVFSIFAGILLALRKTMGDRYSSRFFYGLWIILLIRLIVPMSIFNEIAPVKIDMSQMSQMKLQKDPLSEQNMQGGGLNTEYSEQISEKESQILISNTAMSIEQVMTQMTLHSLITLIWFAGLLISLTIVTISYFRFRQKIMSEVKALSLGQVQATDGLINEGVLVTKANLSPMVIGIFKPRLILTESLFEWDEEVSKVILKVGAREVIRHELIHLKRKDILLKYLYLLARSIHWFNPIVYLIGPVINEDIELSCDEHLAKTMNLKEKKDYCRVILNLATDTVGKTNLYSTNFNGGLFFMKKRFKNIMKSEEKTRGVSLSVLLALVITASAVLISCSSEKNSLNPNEFLGIPSYHLFQYRSEPADMFFESDEKIGLQVLDGIFLYNYKEDKMEAEFALSDKAFKRDFYTSTAMSENEKTLIITAYNPSSGAPVDYFYEYNISKKTIKRINKNPEGVKTVKHPTFERQEKVLKAETWDVVGLRYYPEGSEEAVYPFKEESLPYKKYIMQRDNDKIPYGMLTLTDDGRFEFMYSVTMSYLNFGHFKAEGSKYTLTTSDGERTFVFTKDGDHLIFNEDESYECILDNKEKMIDGTVFTLE